MHRLAQILKEFHLRRGCRCVLVVIPIQRDTELSHQVMAAERAMSSLSSFKFRYAVRAADDPDCGSSRPVPRVLIEVRGHYFWTDARMKYALHTAVSYCWPRMTVSTRSPRVEEVYASVA